MDSFEASGAAGKAKNPALLEGLAQARRRVEERTLAVQREQEALPEGRKRFKARMEALSKTPEASAFSALLGALSDADPVKVSQGYTVGVFLGLGVAITRHGIGAARRQGGAARRQGGADSDIEGVLKLSPLPQSCAGLDALADKIEAELTRCMEVAAQATETPVVEAWSESSVTGYRWRKYKTL